MSEGVVRMHACNCHSAPLSSSPPHRPCFLEDKGVRAQPLAEIASVAM